MKLNLIKIAFVTLFILSINACEDKISVSLDQGVSQLVVDGFVNNLPKKQEIRLTMSAPYFDNSGANAVSDAIVNLTDDKGKVFNFKYENNGKYTYTPVPSDSFCAVGRKYTLDIAFKGENFYSNSMVNPLPQIDSIISKKNDQNPFAKDSDRLAEFFSTDLKGRADYYWIRTTYNDTVKVLGNSDISADGSFSVGASDGLPFIPPMRQAINRQGKSYVIGDTISMQLLSIDEGTFNFLNEVLTQTTNGGLFATPPANVRTNMKNRNPQSNTKALGWFCTSVIREAGIRMR